LLERQIAKYLGISFTSTKELIAFFNSISDTYDGFDQDRALVERSLDLSSQELIETNKKLRDEAKAQAEILNNLRKATAALRPEENQESKWLTSEDEVMHLANSLTNLIEERKLQEKKLIRLASFPEENPNPVIQIDVKGTIIYLNPSAKKVFPDLHIGLSKHPLVDGFSLKEYERREITISEAVYEEKICFIAKSNVVILFITDITEQKKAETILNNLADAIFAVDGKGDIIYLNPAGEKILERPREEILHTHYGAAFNMFFDSVSKNKYTVLLDHLSPDLKLFIGPKQLPVAVASSPLNHNSGLTGRVVIVRPRS